MFPAIIFQNKFTKNLLAALFILVLVTACGNSHWSYTPTAQQSEASRIMGAENFIGPNELTKLGIWLPDPLLAKYGDIPYTRTTLVALKDTHLLVLVPEGYSVNDLQTMTPAGTIAFSNEYTGVQPFTSDIGSPVTSGWLLIRKYPASVTFNRTETDQRALLVSGKEFPPDARQLVFAAVAYHALTGKPLMQGVATRTSTTFDIGDYRYNAVVNVGVNADGQVRIYASPGYFKEQLLGMTALWTYP